MSRLASFLVPALWLALAGAAPVARAADPMAALVAGDAALARGDAGGALESLAEAASAAWELRDLALLLEARALLALGCAEPALAKARASLAASPHGARAADAEWLAAECLAALGRDAEAARAFDAFARARPRERRAGDAGLRAAEALERSGSSEAPARWLDLAMERPVLAPADALDRARRLARERGVRIEAPTDAALLERAERLAKGGALDRAVLAFGELAATRGDRPIGAAAHAGLAQCLFLLRDNARCEDVAREAERRYPRNDNIATLRLLRLRVAWRLEDHEAFEALATEALADPRLARAKERDELLRVHAAWLQERECLDDAATAWERLAREHPASDLAAEARWRVAWCRMEQGVLDEARARFEALASERATRGLAPGALFWAARCAEARDDASGARALRETLVARHPWTQQAAEARDLLAAVLDPQALAALDARGLESGVVATAPAPPRLDASPAARRYARLRDAGLDRHALPELEAHRAAVKDAPGLLVELAGARVRAGEVQSAQALLRRVMGEALDEPSRRTPVELWRLVYPRVAGADLDEQARRHAVDPAFAAAIIRSESWWNPDARSSVDARGLMQLVVPTARRLATAEGLADFDPEQLFDPALNVRLGTRYLGELLRRYGGDEVAAAAAYNAGEDAVDEWWESWEREGTKLRTERIDRIPYRETRPYVRRVLEAAGWYRWLDEVDVSKRVDSEPLR